MANKQSTGKETVFDMNVSNMPRPDAAASSEPVALNTLEPAEKARVAFELTRIHNLLSRALTEDLLHRFGEPPSEKRP